MNWIAKVGKNKPFWIGVAVVALVAVVSGWVLRPHAAVEQALERLSQLERSRFEGSLVLENVAATEQLLGEAGQLEVSFNGQYDRSAERSNVASDVVVAIKTDSVSITINGEVRLVGDKAYVFIERVPSAFGAIAAVKGEWLEFDRGVPTETEAQAQVSDFVVSVDRHGTERIEGESTVRYEAQATSEAVVAFMDGVASLLGSDLSQEQIDQIRANVAEVESVPFTVWIHRFDSRVAQLKANITVPGGNTALMRVRFFDRNKATDITAPEDSKTIDEIAVQLQEQG